jgi:hypothetical protein
LTVLLRGCLHYLLVGATLLRYCKPRPQQHLIAKEPA